MLPNDWITIVCLLAIAALVAVVDLALWRFLGIEYTFSRLLRRLNNKHWVVSWVVVFIAGCLVGHFFL